MSLIVKCSKMYKLLQKFHKIQATNSLFMSKRNYSIVKRETKAWHRLMINSGFPKRCQVLQLLPYIVEKQNACLNSSKRNFCTSKQFFQKNPGEDQDDDDKEQRE